MTKSPSLTRGQWFVLCAAFLGWMFDGVEMGLFPIAARSALHDLMSTVGPAGERVFPAEAVVGGVYSYFVAAFLLGAATGGILFGWMGDRMGRVRTMALSIGVYSLFTGLCAAATAPWQLGICRFLAALGMGGEWALGVALVMECWPERFRPLLAGVIGAAANIGLLCISLLGVVIAVTPDQWRWIMVAGAVPGLLAIFIIFFIPESQKWKESVQGVASRPLREVFSGRLLRPTVLGIAFASVALIGTWGAVSAYLPLWTDQLAGGDAVLEYSVKVRESLPENVPLVDIESVQNARVVDQTGRTSDPARPSVSSDTHPYQLRKKHGLKADAQPGETIALRLVVTNNGHVLGKNLRVEDTVPLDRFEPKSVIFRDTQSVHFDSATGRMTWTIKLLKPKNQRAKAWVQSVLAIGAILGCFAGPLLANRLGRRPAYFLLCVGSLLSCMVLFGLLDTYNWAFVAVVGVVGLLTASFYGWLPLYLPEIFPTRVRATGQGVAFNSGRILAAVGALTTGQLLGLFDGSYPHACVTISLVYLVGMALIWLAPETRGKPLPE
ncbi:MAG: MFS transporter [Pirellulales bacterium]|nr:MFS transporter [Pirellulales bacterium]